MLQRTLESVDSMEGIELSAPRKVGTQEKEACLPTGKNNISCKNMLLLKDKSTAAPPI